MLWQNHIKRISFGPFGILWVYRRMETTVELEICITPTPSRQTGNFTKAAYLSIPTKLFFLGSFHFVNLSWYQSASLCLFQ